MSISHKLLNNVFQCNDRKFMLMGMSFAVLIFSSYLADLSLEWFSKQFKLFYHQKCLEYSDKLFMWIFKKISMHFVLKNIIIKLTFISTLNDTFLQHSNRNIS
jgi:hypothetical protein